VERDSLSAKSWRENESKICTELTFPLTHHHAALTPTSREQGEQRVSRARRSSSAHPSLWVFNSA
jgi:hypothetical protein